MEGKIPFSESFYTQIQAFLMNLLAFYQPLLRITALQDSHILAAPIRGHIIRKYVSIKNSHTSKWKVTKILAYGGNTTNFSMQSTKSDQSQVKRSLMS
jgi:hypothetical protein